MISDAYDIGTAIRLLTVGRPLVIVDADEVLLRFVDGFDRFLGERGLYLDLGTYRLHGNVKRRDDNTAVLDVEVTALLEEFRRDLDALEAVEGACEALTRLAAHADVVVLSNISPLQARARRRNLDKLGLAFPLVCNSGPKGSAAQALCSKAGRPIFFIDDIPQHLVSVQEAIPDALLIHLVGDARLKPILPHCPQAHLRADSWADAAQFMHGQLESKA